MQPGTPDRGWLGESAGSALQTRAWPQVAYSTLKGHLCRAICKQVRRWPRPAREHEGASALGATSLGDPSTTQAPSPSSPPAHTNPAPAWRGLVASAPTPTAPQLQSPAPPVMLSTTSPSATSRSLLALSDSAWGIAASAALRELSRPPPPWLLHTHTQGTCFIALYCSANGTIGDRIIEQCVTDMRPGSRISLGCQ